MIIRNKESGETIEVMDGSIIAESAWEVVEKKEKKEKKETSADKDSEAKTEGAGKSKKK
nr:MAG TPA: hypothetical protein [Caudoviricetes sp.]